MKLRLMIATAAIALAMPVVAANAQGIIGGAQQGSWQGAREGNRTLGPVGGFVGGVVGGAAGAAVGGVKGAIGVPQRGYVRYYNGRHYKYRSARYHDRVYYR